MTEEKWKASTRPLEMLMHIRTAASERKVLLFDIACCRRIWTRLDSEDREAVVAVETNIDNPAGLEEFQLRLLPERTASLVMAGLLDRTCEVSHVQGPERTYGLAMQNLVRQDDYVVPETLARLLTTRTTVRLRLDGRRGVGSVGSVAYEVARLSALPEPAVGGLADLDRIVPPKEMAAEERSQAELVRDVFGNPFCQVTRDPRWLAWRDGRVEKLAQTIYIDRDFELMPILADTLEEAGCNDDAILTHCRDSRQHVLGCWLVDLLLGKA